MCLISTEREELDGVCVRVHLAYKLLLTQGWMRGGDCDLGAWYYLSRFKRLVVMVLLPTLYLTPK